MERNYKCLNHRAYKAGDYSLVPIRDEDKFLIMKWRNDQLDILRQKTLLDEQQQNLYFKNVVDKLFQEEKPDQLLFSFLKHNEVIGYGGLVHIDWPSCHGEVSFISETTRAKDKSIFIEDWGKFLSLLKMTAADLRFNKIFTYAYDVRPYLFVALEQNNFVEEARLKDQVLINDRFHDVRIHSFFLNTISFRKAAEGDILLYFNWANDADVRKNSFNSEKIEWENHTKWFSQKLDDQDTVLFIASWLGQDVGQIRFDKVGGDHYEIGFSIDHAYRGKSLGSKIIKFGTEELIKTIPDVKRVVGKVKKSNQASAKSFLNAGFKHLEVDNEIDSYYLDNNP